MLNFHGHSQCPCINVSRLSVLHYDTVAYVVNIPGKSMSTGKTHGLEVAMPSMPPKDTSMLDWNRNTIKIKKKSDTIFVSTNSKPDPYLGLKDHTNWENSPP